MMMNAARIAGPCRRLAFRGAAGTPPSAAPAPATLAAAARRLSAAATARARLAAAAGTVKTQVGRLNLGEKMGNMKFVYGLGGGVLMAGLHSATGSANDFYEYKFKSKKDVDDIAGFYGGEELMELFCIFPMVNKIMMRLASFDDTGRITTQGIPGTMAVDMVFSDESNAEGQTDWFNKRERFKDTLFGYTCWDMVINYGVRTLEDGTYECYHVGEYFHGNLPVVSQVMLTVFKIHARWVAWATEHHINHFAFTQDAESEDWRALRTEEAALHLEHDSRVNMPMFLLRKYAFSDLLAMLFGYNDKEKEPSFLVTDRSSDPQDDQVQHLLEVANQNDKPATDKAKFPLWQAARGRSDAEEDTSLGLGWNQAALDRAERDKLPFRRKDVQIQISEDIAADKRMVQQMLASHRTTGTKDVHDVMVRRSTLARRQTSAIMAMKRGEDAIAEELEESEELVKTPYQMATDLALNRGAMRRLTRQATRRHAEGMAGDGPGSIAAIAKANFEGEKAPDAGGEVPMATSPAQGEGDGEGDNGTAAV